MGSLEAPKARYKQVAELLRDAIKRGEYPAGTSLPSQPELAREYDLNQSSISRAMAMLRSEGLIRTEHGKGSVVLEVPTVKRVRRIDKDYRSRPAGSSFAEELTKAGRTSRTELVTCDAVDAPADIAEVLHLGESEQALLRKRHMYAEDKPIQIAASYIPMSVAGGVDIAKPDTGPSGMYARIAERGFGPVRFTEDIEVRGAKQDEADFLNISAGQPVFAILRTAFDQDDHPVETCLNVLAALQWKLTYAWEQDTKS
ncbi:GntR family transcriptional regulator [Nocardiopsis sp. CT-R113]|uniref:GntR family transcriptional regulator n=1 Tax=Nocardiopsis codii TaxID=3065942 RepID=A0ABU7K1P9_9ACTN|nr:GntR family transcriptional regulator [Nocardiopsis sp. CT-R113]MEE2036114.1 GntR family transcriptional regulator [Nocardiopsis sp. CT-R113]